MLKITANGLEFACLAEGPEDGPLALLLHGFPDTAHTWSHVLPELAARGFRAVAPFMRGFHPTAIPADADFSVVTLGRDALALVEALGRERAVVIGHDWGAYASYAAANLAPGKVAKLVTVAIPHPRAVRLRHLTPARLYRGRHFVELRSSRAPARIRANGFAALEAICRRWSPTWELPPTELDAVKECFRSPGSLEAALGYYRTLQLVGADPELLERTGVPSLAIYGKDDGVADAGLFEVAREAFTAPHTLVAIERAGHFVHREQPARFAEALLSFVAL